MSPAPQFMFDVGSPNAYLSHEAIPAIEKRTGVKFEYVPILLGGIFVLSGYGKLMGLSAFAASLEQKGVPFASVMALIGAPVEFFGGLAIVLGIETRYAAALMVGFVIVATLISHRFWEYQDAVRQMQQTQFVKNVAIIGGFVVLFVQGGGRFTLARLWRRD